MHNTQQTTTDWRAIAEHRMRLLDEQDAEHAAITAAVQRLKEAGTPTDAGPQYAAGWQDALAHVEGALTHGR